MTACANSLPALLELWKAGSKNDPAMLANSAIEFTLNRRNANAIKMVKGYDLQLLSGSWQCQGNTEFRQVAFGQVKIEFNPNGSLRH